MSHLRVGWVILAPLLLGACILGPLLAREQEFNKYEISFKVPIAFDLEEYTLDLQRGISSKGSASYDQGVVMNVEKNFILEWVYEPQFTSELARLQVLNGPAFYESTDPRFNATISSNPATEHISGFDVTFAEMTLHFSPDNQASGIIGVWYCQASQRAIIFLALHKRPLEELERFVGSFSCN